jgi:hypothetical protein
MPSFQSRMSGFEIVYLLFISVCYWSNQFTGDRNCISMWQLLWCPDQKANKTLETLMGMSMGTELPVTSVVSNSCDAERTWETSMLTV